MPLTVANDILFPALEALLRDGKSVRFTPRGTSMRPFIEGGKDSVVVAPISGSIRRGDIVLAHLGDDYILHRVYCIENRAERPYVLMGDGNLSRQEFCNRADIVGRVTQIVSPSGKSKPLTRGRLWRWLLPLRTVLLKFYRFVLRCKSNH